ncbi:uncharacterized protein YMR317W isoform X3 [Hermetia illucens]|nr:uncharacterized protein YMR317W isoform X3 [Hermetia illucens]
MATTAKQQQVRGSSSSSSSSTSTKTSTTKSIKSPSGTTTIIHRSTSIDQSTNFIETEEDIASIAKQISDHAEAIYQTWKARGLAPTEILNCHTVASEAFGKALNSSARNNLDVGFLAQSPDMSNNNLEKLVNSFVNEDKARQQAARKTTTGGTTSLSSGTIKDALRKFEGSTSPAGYVKPNFLVRNAPAATTKPNYQKMTINSSGPIGEPSGTPTKIASPLTTTSRSSATGASPSLFSSSAASLPSTSPDTNTNQLSKSVPDVLIDTIGAGKQLPKTSETKTNSKSSSLTSVLPSVTAAATPSPTSSGLDSRSASQSGAVDVIDSPPSIISTKGLNNSANSISVSPLSSSSRKPQTPAKPANLINHQPSWPLKNRLALGASGAGTASATTIGSSGASGGNGSLGASAGVSGGAIIKNGGVNKTTNSGDDYNNTIKTIKQIDHLGKGSPPSSADLLDEVSREEERLINALKTGIVLNNHDHNLAHHAIQSHHHNKLPEVITSTLNDKKTALSSLVSISDRNISSKNNWNRPDVSTASLIGSVKFSQSGSTVASINSTISPTTTTSPTIVAQQSSLSPTNIQRPNLTSWNNDATKQQQQPTAITITTTTASSPALPNQQSQLLISQFKTTETMSPAPTPAKMKLRPKNDAVPHPEAKQNSNNANHNNNMHVNSRTNNLNPVRPFLTRGSVAERVLMFEKCPDVKAPLRNINRDASKSATKPLVKPAQQTHTTLQRHIRSSSKNVYIPRFHFPHGKPLPTIATETMVQRLKSAFDSSPGNQVTKEDFHQILKICGLPFYWRMPLMACTQHQTSGHVDGYRFIDFWKQMSVYCHDTASRFVHILSRGQRSRPYILHEDLISLVQDVVDTHPGLAFLKEAQEFHSRYVHTVIARIFYSVNRSWSGKITVPELRRSNLLQVIQLLEEEEDINQIMAYFSYEHFYVIYCKFWELDRDHDLYIDQNDLARHNDHALSTRIIERIFSGCVTRGGKTRVAGPTGPKMSYTDFVWFLLSEEDKTNPTAIEYWFRCMDLDGDGIISMYELEYFYEEQQQRMESIGIETLPFEDCLCQMLDMIKPVRPGCITLGDLKRCRMTPIFFDTFFNLEKYLEHEQRDPFAAQRDNDDMSDWDRYAAQEYELLVAEEGGDTQG